MKLIVPELDKALAKQRASGILWKEPESTKKDQLSGSQPFDTNAEIEHLNYIKNMKKYTELLIWILLVVYSVVTILMFGFKMFSMEGNAPYKPGGPASKIYVFSVLDVIFPEDVWLLVTTVILNIGIIIVSSFNYFNKDDKKKNILRYVLLGLFVASITFFIITLKVGTKNPSSLWQF